MLGRTIDEVIEERELSDPAFVVDWEAQRSARRFAISVIRFHAERGLPPEGSADAVRGKSHIISHLEIGEAPQCETSKA